LLFCWWWVSTWLSGGEVSRTCWRSYKICYLPLCEWSLPMSLSDWSACSRLCEHYWGDDQYFKISSLTWSTNRAFFWDPTQLEPKEVIGLGFLQFICSWFFLPPSLLWFFSSPVLLWFFLPPSLLWFFSSPVLLWFFLLSDFLLTPEFLRLASQCWH
jgi:hypothetical protein